MFLGFSRRLKAVKRYSLVSTLCALLFANVLVVATAQDTEQLSGKCANNWRACEEFWRAVNALTDQTLLAKIAVEEKDQVARVIAVQKLTDQALLAIIAVEDKVFSIRMIAVGKLTDKALLEKFAVEDKDASVRSQAVRKLTDQKLLAKIAFEDKDSTVRLTAVGTLTDLTLLARIAIENNDVYVRMEAIRKLTDQSLFAKIAVGDKNPDVRSQAVEKLTDQALLAKIAVEDKDRSVRSEASDKLADQALLAKIAAVDKDQRVRSRAIAAMDDANPALKRLARLGEGVTFDAERSLARIKLAIQEPRIRYRFPGISSKAEVSDRYSSYGGGRMVEVAGESVSVVLRQAGETLASHKWSTDFPMEVTTWHGDGGGHSTSFLPAKVRGEEVLAELLHRDVFTQDDLAELSSSEIPELRSAARSRLAEIRNNAK
jgi:hypothetical protein